MINIKLLFIIIDEGSAKKIKYFLNKFGIRVKIVTNANGTASSSILNYFGLTETKKEIFMAIIPDYLSSKILTKINDEFSLKNIGTGIAFTIPIASSNKYLSESFTNNNSNRGELKMKNSSNKYHLVMTVVSEGNLEQVMTAAKRAGASGGTVIKGRGLGDLKHAKILGFNIQPEKDVVLNIVSEKDKTKVMEEITKEVGIKTAGKGICFSLPIEDVIGLPGQDLSEEL